MASRSEYLYTSAAGIKYYLRHEDDGSIHLDGYQDVQHILDDNVNQANENNGWNADKTMRRAAAIPMQLANKWKQEGLDIFNADHFDDLKKRLNDADWAKLRTANWNM